MYSIIVYYSPIKTGIVVFSKRIQNIFCDESIIRVANICIDIPYKVTIWTAFSRAKKRPAGTNLASLQLAALEARA